MTLFPCPEGVAVSGEDCILEYYSTRLTVSVFSVSKLEVLQSLLQKKAEEDAKDSPYGHVVPFHFCLPLHLPATAV